MVYGLRPTPTPRLVARHRADSHAAPIGPPSRLLTRILRPLPLERAHLIPAQDPLQGRVGIRRAGRIAPRHENPELADRPSRPEPTQACQRLVGPQIPAFDRDQIADREYP